MGVRHMQGVPAQLEFVKKKDKRRYPTHCIFCEVKTRICICPQGNYYMDRCSSSQRCSYYEER